MYAIKQKDDIFVFPHIGENKVFVDSFVINLKLFMKKYKCSVCEWIYDPAIGDPDGGIAPGIAFEDIPEDWVCPLCGVGKDMFEVVEE